MTTKRKKGKSIDLLTIGVLSLLAVGSWVSFDVYRAITKTTLTEVVQRQIEPLKIDLSIELLKKLQSRVQLDPLLLNTVRPIQSGGFEDLPATAPAEIVPTPTLEASPSGELESPEATTSG